jgi:hypothetical protein
LTAVIQIEAIHSDQNPNNHKTSDTYDQINQNYLYQQMQATTAIVGQLAEAITLQYQYIPLFNWLY